MFIREGGVRALHDHHPSSVLLDHILLLDRISCGFNIIETNTMKVLSLARLQPLVNYNYAL